MMRMLEDIIFMLVLEYSYSQILNCAMFWMFFVVLTAVLFSFFLLLFLMQVRGGLKFFAVSLHHLLMELHD